MDLVLVGLPGSGKSVVGKRLAHRHGATFIDLDERIEREDGRPIPLEGEPPPEAPGLPPPWAGLRERSARLLAIRS